MSTLFRLHPHFEASIPVGRAINPITHNNWQGHGVLPDIAIPAEKALDAAYQLALENLYKDLSETSAPVQLRLLEEVRSTLENLPK